MNEELLYNIKRLCKEHEITVTTLEKELNIGAGTISRWNKASPSLDKIVKIASKFKVSVDELIGYTMSIKTEVCNEDTKLIISYLNEMTVNNEIYWNDCYSTDLEGIQELSNRFRKTEQNKLLYACCEEGFYLFEVNYKINEWYDYDTRLRLYLLPEEDCEPILETDDIKILRELLINIMNQIEELHRKRDSQNKARIQREKVINKYK